MHYSDSNVILDSIFYYLTTIYNTSQGSPGIYIWKVHKAGSKTVIHSIIFLFSQIETPGMKFK